jgi:hypothetical protein
MTVALPPAMDVRPGDQRAVRQIDEWFRSWQATGDPAIRERIILAHLGLAERLASRFRHSGAHGAVGPELGGRPGGAHRRRRQRLTAVSARRSPVQDSGGTVVLLQHVGERKQAS